MKKIAMVGTGNIFETAHYPAFSRGCEVVAVSDVLGERAQAAAQAHGIPRWFTSTEEMLAATKPDIVCVCVPNKFHCETVLLALRYGCHVFCEKPPALNAREAAEMARLARQNNLLLAYNLHHRHCANVEILQKQLAGGALGEIYNAKVCAVRRRGVPGWGNFTSKVLQGGGPLIDIGVHMLDVALYLMGYPKPRAAFAASYNHIGTSKSKGLFGAWDPARFEVEDSLFGLITFENGASLTLETAFALNIKAKDVMNVWLHGTQAGASVFPLELYGETGGELSDTTFPFSDEKGSYRVCAERFLARCDGGDAMVADGEQGYLLQRIMDMLYLSAESGDLVAFA
jgi:predicted dehydrogenase